VRKIGTLAHFRGVEVLHIKRFPYFGIGLQDPFVTVDGFIVNFISLGPDLIEDVQRNPPASL